jgi:prepilin-type processing-associated H-X9-DG protein
MNGEASQEPLSAVPEPAQRALLADGHWGGSWWQAGLNQSDSLPDAVHHGGANFGFADGHVSWLSFSDYQTNMALKVW